jgi:DNA-binding transcriptional MocR family regulator
LLERLRTAKQATDLHTDQLSQAVLLQFAESGRLNTHRAKVLHAGAERLAATLAACGEFLPEGSSWTRPAGGMNVWVRLPEPLDAGDLLGRAQRAGVAYLPGRFFSVGRLDPGTLRLSFAGLAPMEIRRGLEILRSVIDGELEISAGLRDPGMAMV